MFSFLKNLLAGIGFIVILVVGMGMIVGIGYEWIAALLVLLLVAIYLARKP
ncbi:hypothetical protein LCGC14_2214100 [marine sediment metagenome]|uniref:Uncharacterized protein n=1 Tax=marine sediment metagenome TaxID=412755 RepID=A0A0F9FQG1_9ZZZZ